jgi:ABC-type lipoprotein export system ATPase subunit
MVEGAHREEIDMSEPVAHLVQVQQLTRVYRAGARQVHALQGVDLTVARGAFVALRGRSGSGKTTLLNCIGGLDTPTSGQVFVEGRNVAHLSERERTALRRRIGFVFQSFALLPTFSAWENVDLALRIAGVDGRQRRARTEECLSLVGLARWADHRPYELSGGQQQRVAIARALALRPSLILADEPTGELDSATGRQIMALLRRIVDERGTTVLIATHDLTVAEYATALYDLHDGQIAGPWL